MTSTIISDNMTLLMTEDNQNLDLKDPKVYEIGYLLLPLIPEADKVKIVASDINSLITEVSGTIMTETAPEMRKLEYTIRKMISNKYAKFSEAYFGAVKFTVRPDQIKDIDNGLKKSENVLRYILIEIPKFKETKVKPRKLAEAIDSDTVKKADQVDIPVDPASIDKEIDNLLEEPTS